MEIHVTTKPSEHEIWATRDDGVAVAVVSAAGRTALPHELFHYVVEDSIGLEWGFWDCVAKGALFGSMRIRSGLADELAREQSSQVRQEAGSRADEAEFFVSALELAFDADLETDTEAAKELVRRRWPQLPCPPLETVDMVRVKQRVGELTQRWLSLGDDGKLAVAWPSTEAGRLRVHDAPTPSAGRS